MGTWQHRTTVGGISLAPVRPLFADSCGLEQLVSGIARGAVHQVMILLRELLQDIDFGPTRAPAAGWPGGSRYAGRAVTL